MMGKLSGFDFASRVLNMPGVEFTPIIFCSALVGDDEKVMGLNIGADDYITKPFNIPEVKARVRAVLRRAYIDSVLGSLKGNLDNTYLVDEKGNREKLKKKGE